MGSIIDNVSVLDTKYLMAHQIRTPPKINIPQSARWSAVFELTPNCEIWVLEMRTEPPGGYYFIVCTLLNGIAKPKESIQFPIDQNYKTHGLRQSCGDRFFWSLKDGIFVIMDKSGGEYYFQATHATQEFRELETFEVVKVLADTHLMLLPNANYKEVFRFVHPDQARP